MTGIKNFSISKKIIIYETITFLVIILFIWFDELIDIPHLLFGFAATPVNWPESLFETIAIGCFALVIIYHSHKMFKRITYLEGILPVCASCKQIRDESGHWHQIETYIHERSAVEFSHGICPECCKKLYPELSLKKMERLKKNRIQAQFGLSVTARKEDHGYKFKTDEMVDHKI